MSKSGSVRSMPEGWAPVQCTRRTISIVASIALFVAGCLAIELGRTTSAVDGTIMDVRRSWASWLAGGSIVLWVQTGDGRSRTVSLGAACEGAAKSKSDCVNPVFPIGSRVRLEISNAYHTCGSADCNWRLRRRSGYFRKVRSIEVDGRLVTTGWWNSSGLLVPYVYLAALAAVLAWHEWRPGRIPARTYIAFASVFWVIFADLIFGAAAHFM